MKRRRRERRGKGSAGEPAEASSSALIIIGSSTSFHLHRHLYECRLLRQRHRLRHAMFIHQPHCRLPWRPLLSAPLLTTIHRHAANAFTPPHPPTYQPKRRYALYGRHTTVFPAALFCANHANFTISLSLHTPVEEYEHAERRVMPYYCRHYATPFRRRRIEPRPRCCRCAATTALCRERATVHAVHIQVT